MTSTPSAAALSLAVQALDEIAPRGAVGDVVAATVLHEGVLGVQHASLLPGYPDWLWTVLISDGVEGGPTVLEATLLPSESSLIAPEWVPWADRLADYLAAREADAVEDGDDELDTDAESADDDFDDFDEDDLVGDAVDDEAIEDVFPDDADDDTDEHGDDTEDSPEAPTTAE